MSSMKSICQTLFIFSIFFVATLISLSHAQAQFFVGPEASATGNAGRAAVDPGETVFLNPASLAFLQRYHVTGYYGLQDHPNDGHGNLWGISLADGSSENMVPGALSYVKKRIDQNNGVSDTQQDIQIGIAGNVSQVLALGISGHRLTDQILSNYYGAEYNQYNATIGAILTPIPNIGIAFVAYDFLPMNDAIPVGVHVVPTMALGGNFVYQKSFRLRLDLIRPDTNNDGRRINVAAGFESFLAGSFALRAGGYWRETADETYVTAGLGLLGPKLSCDYSFQQDVRNGANSRHLIDLWLPL